MLNRRDSFRLLAAGMASSFMGVKTAQTFANAADAANPAVPAPEFAGPDHPTDPNAWTMAVIGDPQSYVKYGRNQGILELMTAWLLENAEKFRIKQVLVTGDLVEQNNMGVGQYNQTSRQQWIATSRAFERLDGVLPYIICTGNHDYGIRNAENRETQVNDYFPADRNSCWKDTLVEMGENTFGKKTLENAAYEFTTPSGTKTLTISLPFAPTDENLQWAKSVAQSEKYMNHFVTILTHSYMRGSGERPETEKYALNKAGGNAGEGIWQKLVKTTPNIRLVVNGHFAGADDWSKSTGFRVDKNDAGKDVAQMMFNMQAMGGGYEGNGGDGWIRLLEFSGDMKKVKFRTVSPLYAVLPQLKAKSWERSPFNQFAFTFD